MCALIKTNNETIAPIGMGDDKKNLADREKIIDSVIDSFFISTLIYSYSCRIFLINRKFFFFCSRMIRR